VLNSSSVLDTASMNTTRLCTSPLTRHISYFLFPLLTFLPFLCALNTPLKAQQQSNVVVQPDCIASFVLSGVGTQQINNLAAGCVNWSMSYSSTGFSALNIVVQTAPDAGGGVPGSWSTFTAVTGSNPSTVTTSTVSTYGGTTYFPFVRVDVTSVTGTGKITGTLYGYKNSAGGSGGGGGPSSDVVITNVPLPVTLTNALPCQDASKNHASLPIVITTSGTLQIVPAVGGEAITICSISFLGSSAANFTLEYGTGSSCGTGTTAITGAYNTALGIALDQYNITLPTSAALCLVTSASTTAGGVITFSQN
jgi:hypothetical protein